MGRSAGTGSPIAFRCPVDRRQNPLWNSEDVRRNGYEARSRTHVITLTGRKRRYHSAQGSALGTRSDYFAREYTCACGHTGWSAHFDIARMAGESTRDLQAVRAWEQGEPVPTTIPAATNGIDCLDCGEVTDVGQSLVSEFDPCPRCESENTQPAVLTPCADGESCDADAHHWGLGKHVTVDPR